ncbi:MAG: DUF885 domain-containing protein, partial [Chloroflexi bacterium]|nr:DUF885 domain-containing protein [Chloroflexota bacterium]
GYAAWCRDLAGRATGGFAIGTEAYEALLRDREVTQYTGESLRAMGDELYAETEAKLAEAAKALGDEDWRATLGRLRREHPGGGDEVLAAYREQVSRARSAVVASGIVTVPEGEVLDVVPTPDFARPTLPFAAYLDGPAFGEDSKHGRFWVTLPAEGAALEEQLAAHPTAGIQSIVVHEAYPGHHLQSAKAASHGSMVRKHLWSSALVEGWGLYSEGLMAELGFIASPEARFLQLADLLLRAARVGVDVGLATGSLSYEQGVELLASRAGLARPQAEAEVLRYTLEPVQASTYAIGRKAILDMRVRARERGWGMKDFHDRLLGAGALPPKLLEDELF